MPRTVPFAVALFTFAIGTVRSEEKTPPPAFLTDSGRFTNTRLSESVVIPAGKKPYKMNSAVMSDNNLERPALTITIEAGCEFSGIGVFHVCSKDILLVKGTREKPVIFSGKSFGIAGDGPAQVIAEYAIFDKSRITLGTSQRRAQFIFKSCIFNNCSFTEMSNSPKDGSRYKLHMTDCAIINTPWQDFSLEDGKKDFAEILQKENILSGCVFMDSKIGPTVFWSSTNSNYYGCKFMTAVPFQSEVGLKVEAYVFEPNPNLPKNATSKPVEITLAKKPFPFPSLPSRCPVPELQKYFRQMYANGVPK